MSRGEHMDPGSPEDRAGRARAAGGGEVPTDRFRESVAAYLLGALPELEEQAFERHVMGCAGCRDDLERLRPAVEALPRSVLPLTAPPGLKQSIMAVVSEEARSGAAAETAPREGVVARSRRRAARLLAGVWPRPAAATAAVLAAGALAGVGLGALVWGGADETRLAAEVDESRLVDGSATLALPEDEERAVLSVHGLPTLPDGGTDEVYQAWLVQGNEIVPSTVFTVDSEGAGAATLLEDLENVDAVWVTREPAGGSRAPSEKPVMKVDLS